MCGGRFTSLMLKKKRAHSAAFWSAMIILVTAFIVTSYVKNKIYIAAAFMRAYIGTFVTIKWKIKTERSNDS